MRSKGLAARRIRIALVLNLMVASAAFGVTVVVTSTADLLTGCSLFGVGAACTLRDAITYSNWNPQPPDRKSVV